VHYRIRPTPVEQPVNGMPVADVDVLEPIAGNVRNRRQRVRDVRQGPDGALYLVTDQENGQVWKIVPRG
jgi:glucose/arabinose dehydrogenase